MSVTVGVDGGQSQIRMQVSGEPEIYAPGVSHLEADTIEAIVHIVAKLWDSRELDVSRLVAGLTTIPASDEDRRTLAKELADVTGAFEVWVGDDTVTAHAGALNGATGVVLSIGTGVACLAVDAETGAHRSFDGAGYLIGDGGGGFWLGRHGIRAIIAADEGRGPRTSLTKALEPRLGPIDGLAIRLHTHPRAVDTISQLAPLILAEAAAGDRVSEGIVAGAAAHLVNTASAAVAFLAPSPDVLVALGGGLMLESNYLAELVVDGLHAKLPGTEVAMAKGTGLDGASALAGAVTPGPYQDFFTMYRSSS